MELFPQTFNLTRYKSRKRYEWKRYGMKISKEDFDYIYNEYINASYCDLCSHKFVNRAERHLDHCHKTGEVRNIVCRSCNGRRTGNKIYSNNTTGFKNIYKKTDKKCAKKYLWTFKIRKHGKIVIQKSSTNKQFIIDFAEKWVKDNNYYV
jgi:hypothetical protein